MLDKTIIWLTLGIGSLALLMFIDIFVQRLRYQGHQRRYQERYARLLPQFYEYICGDMDLPTLTAAVGRSTLVAQDIILHFLHDLTGDGRERLIIAADEMGLLHRTLRDLDSPDWTERDLAVMRLGRYALEETVPDLVKKLRDSYIQVRYTAARSLGLIGTPEAEDALIDILDRPDLIDAPRILEIVQTMPNHGLRPLRRMLSSENHPLEAKLLAIDLVGDLRVYALIEELLTILNSSSKEKVLRAIKALGKIASPKSINALLTMVNNRPWEIRAQAIKALGLLQVDESVPILRLALSDESYWVRKNAAEALVNFGKTGIEVLDKAQLDGDTFARDTAAYQLEQLNGKAHSLLESGDMRFGDLQPAPRPVTPQYIIGGHTA